LDILASMARASGKGDLRADGVAAETETVGAATVAAAPASNVLRLIGPTSPSIRVQASSGPHIHADDEFL